MDSIRILIVEDEPIIAADLADRLGEMGYEVLGPVPSGEEALILLETADPDLILMDVQLDGVLDGIETTRRIRQQRNIPVIILTSNADERTFMQAKSVRPQAFLSKPFRGKDLRHAIELAIAQMEESSPGSSRASVPEDNAYWLQDRLFIKLQDRMIRLFLQDILWVEADDYYCKVMTREREILVGQTLKRFMEALGTLPEFMRVHRSYVVNLKHIEEIGDVFMVINEQKIPINKAAREELLNRLHKI
jgi:DNA-binding LytR/AlgR family response regulator